MSERDDTQEQGGELPTDKLQAGPTPGMEGGATTPPEADGGEKLPTDQLQAGPTPGAESTSGAQQQEGEWAVPGAEQQGAQDDNARGDVGDVGDEGDIGQA